MSNRVPHNLSPFQQYDMADVSGTPPARRLVAERALPTERVSVVPKAERA